MPNPPKSGPDWYQIDPRSMKMCPLAVFGHSLRPGQPWDAQGEKTYSHFFDIFAENVIPKVAFGTSWKSKIVQKTHFDLLGLHVQEYKNTNNISEFKGVIVKEVQPNSIAEENNIWIGDIIIELGKVDIIDNASYKSELDSYSKDNTNSLPEKSPSIFFNNFISVSRYTPPSSKRIFTLI